jgi:hypothetical protein
MNMRNGAISRTLVAAVIASTAVVAAPSSSTVLAAACSSANVVRAGSNNAEVLRVEQRLNQMGLFQFTPNTVFDNATTAAVKAFQISRGLYPDGVVHSLTSRQLALCGTGDPLSQPVKVSILGDSTVAAIRWYDEANAVSTRYDVIGNSYNLLLSVESCRRLVVTSCTGRTDPSTGFKWTPQSVLPLMRGSLKGQLGQALVIVAGYDDTSIVSAIDQIMLEAMAQGVQRVFWLNYRTSTSYGYGPYYTAHNNALNAARYKYPRLTVLDWNGYSRSQSSATQIAWFAPDDIHLDPAGAVAMASYIKSALDGSVLSRCLPGNARTGATPPSGSPTGGTLPDAGFTAVPASRLLDTRDPAQGGANGMLGGGRAVAVDVEALAPAGATSVALSVTAVAPCQNGYLTVYPCGSPPTISSMNYAAGRTTSTMTVAALSGTTFCVYSSATTDVVVDVVGAFTPGGALFHPISATQWANSLGAAWQVPVLAGPYHSGFQINIPVAGQGPVPADATAAAVTVAAINSTTAGNISLYPGPCSPTPPGTATVTTFRGRSAVADTIVPIGANGGICALVGGASMHMTMHVKGYFGGAPAGGLAYRGIAPTRKLDTRSGARVAAGVTVGVFTPGWSLSNVAAASPTGYGQLINSPCSAPLGVWQVFGYVNEVVSSASFIGPGSNSQECYAPTQPTHIIVDTIGQFVVPTPG